MDEVKITIIGAGVIGLAIAAELSTQYDNLVILEKHDSFGQEISSRNSEIIHTGIYYPQGSLKAKLCVEGIDRLYEICVKNSIPHRKLGKLIVATDQSELELLDNLFKKGTTNRVKNLVIIDKNDVKKMEPNVNAIAAIYSQDTGIIDSHSLMKHFLNMAEDNGVLVAYGSEVMRIDKDSKGFIIGIKQEDYRFKTKILINCAGLSSDHIAGLAGIDIESYGYKLNFCKGSYFSYAKASPVRLLVYPVPHKELAGLGIHATLDIKDRLRFGPDIEYVKSINYHVDKNKKNLFYRSALKIISCLEEEAFIPDMAGIRPKLYGPGEKIEDFIITDETEKGLPNLINLIGIESPGLTASPAIAKMVSQIISKILK